MSPDFPGRGSVRSAADLNEAIRALWLRLGGRPVTVVERREYELLVVEWAAAVRAEGQIVEAA
jgi:hypothetical protein